MSLEIKGSKGSVDILGRDPFPTGGLPGQILTKADSDDTAVYWSGHLIRPNLLDNWYFVGGGSQKGDGQFPINQRGQVSYDNGYGIDRWINTTPITLSDNGVSISGPISSSFRQRLENLPKAKYTLSVLSSDGLFYTTVMWDGSTLIGANDVNGNIGLYLEINGGFAAFRVYVANNHHIVLYAAKLELGEGQTLAHKEANGQWALNEIPNFQYELAKCQRYQIQLGPNWQRPSISVIASTFVDLFIPLPVPLRINPNTNSIANMLGSGFKFFNNVIDYSGWSCPFATVVKNGIQIRFNKPSNVTDLVYVEVHNVLFDANL